MDLAGIGEVWDYNPDEDPSSKTFTIAKTASKLVMLS